MNNPIQISSVTDRTSELQQAIEVVEALPVEAQEILVEIIQKRLHQRHGEELVQTVLEAKQEYAEGNVRRGTVADLMAELMVVFY